MVDPANPPLGGTVAYVRSLSSSLVPSERRVAAVCVERPSEVAWWSAGDLAEAAGTSSSTVIRACKSLGFGGFQHLRSLLLRDAGAGAGAAETAGDETAMLAQTGQHIREGLGVALAGVDEGRLETVADLMAGAGRILVAANGASSAVVQHFALRMAAHGIVCEAPVDALMQQVRARGLGEGDVCLLVSDSGMNAVTLATLDAARETAATVIGLTSYGRSRLVELAEVAVVLGAAEPLGSAYVTNVVAQMVFLNALERALTARLDADGRHYAATMGEVWKIVEPT